jgi:hypothetical protein
MCDKKAIQQVAFIQTGGQFMEPRIYFMCEDHGEILSKQGWLVQELPKGMEHECQWEVAAEEAGVSIPEEPKPPVEKQRGRPKTYRVWASDKYPNYRVVVPSWQDDGGHPQNMNPFVQFQGGILDMRRYAELRGLTRKMVDEANKVLDGNKNVRLLTQLSDYEYKCPYCVYKTKDSRSLGLHLALHHADKLDVVVAVGT